MEVKYKVSKRRVTKLQVDHFFLLNLVTYPLDYGH